MISRIFTLFFVGLPFLFVQAQPVSNSSSLTIEQIMTGEDFVGYGPEDVYWGEDSRTIYFSWNPEMDTLRRLFKVSVDGGQPLSVGYEEQRLLPEGGEYSEDYSKKVFSRQGDLFLLEVGSGKLTRLTQTLDRESNPSFSGDGQKVLFIRDNNLYSWEIATGQTAQLSNFVKGRGPSEKKQPDYRQWLEDEEMELIGVLRDRKTARELRRQRGDSLEFPEPKAIHYGDDRLFGVQASPDLRFISYRLMSDAGGAGTEVPNYVTESGYADNLRARAKVGSPQATSQMGLYDRQRDTFYLIDTKQIEGINDKPAFLRDYHQDTTAFKDIYDKPREVNIIGPFYSDQGKAAVVVRSLDNKDRWIMLLDPATGGLKLLDRQRDEAWVGGPGIVGWNGSAGTIGWIDESTLFFQSEATGFSHLYTVDVNTGKKTALTSGNWEVREVTLSRDKKTFFVSANKESPHELHFYSLPVAGGQMAKITGPAGNHSVYLSPDEQYLAIRYSYSNRPWELYVMENRPGAALQQLTKSTTAEFEKYSWRDPEIVRFRAADGAEVPARLYRPENAQPGGPAVVFVHGAGYLQNVHRWWSSYYREFMFHNLLADNGYTVLDIDYRGSDGYGRDWRTAIYRHMGGKDLSDQVDGARFLVEELGVDPGRIGIYGGSYGGFITLMAMFTAPGTFNSGAALRSVTDWAHYNHGYTSNILNTPVEDPEAYRRSSPIYHAEGLEGNLLILHGMVDVNVHFQDVVRLAQRLIELGKDKWEFAVFPLEDHGFNTASGWTDEYKRIFRLFQQTLRE